MPGVLPMVAALARRGRAARVVVARQCAAEAPPGRRHRDDRCREARGGDRASAARRRRVAGAGHRRARGGGRPDRCRPARAAGIAAAPDRAVPDLADVRGQAERGAALEIALAGGHGLLLIGPPGAGKTLLARTIPGLLPPLGDAEALAATVVASAAGEGR